MGTGSRGDAIEGDMMCSTHCGITEVGTVRTAVFRRIMHERSTHFGITEVGTLIVAYQNSCGF
jgi:hypothetical protein